MSIAWMVIAVVAIVVVACGFGVVAESLNKIATELYIRNDAL